MAASTVSASAINAISRAPRAQCTVTQTRSSSTICVPRGASVGRRRLVVPKFQISKAGARSPFSRRRFNTRISCSAQVETIEVVQGVIAKQLSIEENTVTPETKFADLGADSLDTVEIMMALEEKFGVSVGEGGAENIATVQDAADLIEKVKAAAVGSSS